MRKINTFSKIMTLGFAAAISFGVSANDYNSFEADNFLDAANKAEAIRLQASEPATCDTFSTTPTYYAETASIKIPWLQVLGDENETRYCVILMDTDGDGNFELISRDETSFPPVGEMVLLDNENGVAEIALFNYVEADGSITFTGTTMLVRQDDGQYATEGLVLTPTN